MPRAQHGHNLMGCKYLYIIQKGVQFDNFKSTSRGQGGETEFLNNLNIELTKPRSRHSNDNAFAEGKMPQSYVKSLVIVI